MGENTVKNIFNKINPIILKLKSDKKAMLIILLGLLGMLMILFSGSAEEKQDCETVSSESSYNQNEIEHNLTELIESIKGAGDAKVMITYETAEETVYAVDEEEKTDDKDTNLKKEYIIIENDYGETGLKVKQIYPKVRGVAIICEGGGDPIVEEQIYSLVSALFNISTNKISVAPMA